MSRWDRRGERAAQIEELRASLPGHEATVWDKNVGAARVEVIEMKSRGGQRTRRVRVEGAHGDMTAANAREFAAALTDAASRCEEGETR